MAYATQLTIGTGNKVSINYQSQDVSVSLTYQLEREDLDVLQVVREKAAEVALAHQTAWQRIRDAKVEGVRVENIKAEAVQTPPQTTPTSETASQSAAELAPDASSTADEAATVGQQAALRTILSHIGWSEEQVRDYFATHFSSASIECTSIEQLTQRQASLWLLELQRNERERAQQRRHTAVPLNGKPNPF